MFPTQYKNMYIRLVHLGWPTCPKTLDLFCFGVTQKRGIHTLSQIWLLWQSNI